MKTKWTWAVVLAGVVAGGLAVQAQPTKVLPPTKTNELTMFMRQKLAYSDKILEGISLENYSEIRTNSHLLLMMSKHSTWLTFGNPDFKTQTRTFQQAVIKLQDAAIAKDMPALLQTYSEVTRNCVECHQIFRRDQHILHPEKMPPVALDSK